MPTHRFAERRTWLSFAVLAFLTFGCNPLQLEVVPADNAETSMLVVRCTASQAGTFALTQNGLDGTLAQTNFTVDNQPFRAQTVFRPDVTGRSRGGAIECRHTPQGGGQARNTVHDVVIRETNRPTAQITIPGGPNKRVGTPFDVNVDVRDDPLAPGMGVPAGLDYIFVNADGPLAGTGIIDLAGRLWGPPTNAQGPLIYNTPFQAVCREEGDARIMIRAWDAAGNSADSAWETVNCVR